MRSNKLFWLGIIIAIGWFYITPASAKSVVKGEPEILWRTPTGEKELDNNAKNRCLLIKKIKPGVEFGAEANANNYEILSDYTANLYAQSIKTLAYLDEETEAEKKLKLPGKMNDEISIIKKKITRRMEDIARRINIINSLEAGRVMLAAMTEMAAQENNVYSEVDCGKE